MTDELDKIESNNQCSHEWLSIRGNDPMPMVLCAGCKELIHIFTIVPEGTIFNIRVKPEQNEVIK